MDPAKTKVATEHLRLAKGLIETAEIGGGASDYEIRNAFSRAYYALFHASRGYLWAQGVDVDALGKRHGNLLAEMERWMGRSFGQFLRNSYELRRKSDYEPEWQAPPRYRCAEQLKTARTQCYFLTVTARKLIS